MQRVLIRTRIKNKKPREIFARFDKDLFLELKPPLLNLELKRFDGCMKGHEVHLETSLFGKMKQEWVSLITEHGFSDQECYFIDEGKKLPPPLTFWRHRHRIVKYNELDSEIIDDITYTTGNGVLDKLIYPALYAMFSFRIPIYKKKFKL